MNHSRILIFILFFSLASWADHPNEGAWTLEEITQKALSNSRDVQAAEKSSSAAEFEVQKARGLLHPEISIEGGPLSVKYDETQSSGTAVYGKAEWNLYRGGRDQASIEKARIQRNLQKKKLELTKARVTREAARLYYEMLHVLESLALKEKALQMNHEQMKLARVKKNSGFTSEADVLEFELRESTLKSDLSFLQQEKQSLSRELSLLLGLNPASTPVAVKGHLENKPLEFNREKMDYLQNNEELLETQAELQAGIQDRKSAQSYFLPSLDLEAAYGKLANDERVFRENNNYSVFLKLKIPLYTGFQNSNSLKSVQAQVARKEITLAGTQARIRSEIELLLSALESLENRISLEQKNLARSEKYYQITLAEYRRGIKNSPDVVGATENLLEAQIRNLQFRRDFQLTKLKLLEVNGSTGQ